MLTSPNKPLTRREYYGLDEMSIDVRHMHGVIVEPDATWDEIVPQEVIDQDIAQYLENRRLEKQAETKARLKYEKECEDANLPYCRHCKSYYDPFSRHYCETEYSQGGI